MVLIGFSSGLVVSGAVFAFITVIGIVPRLIERTNTRAYIAFYENCIIMGGIGGSLISFWPIYIPLGKIGLVIIGLSSGVFIGSLLVALAEVINVLPIMSRRINITGGTAVFILILGLGKSIGSLLYWLLPVLQQGK